MDLIAGRPPSFFDELWRRRRGELQAGRGPQAQQLLEQMIEAKQRSGWPDLFVYGESVARESERARTKGALDQAMSLGQAAVELAPHRPATHAALAKAAWSRGGAFWTAAGALWREVVLAWSEPPLVRARTGTMLVAAAIGFLLAAAAFVLASLYRHLRLLLHDWHHLLSPVGMARWQAGVIGVAALLAPVFLRLGPLWGLVLWTTVLGPYYRRRERMAAVGCLALLAALPLVMPWLTAQLAYPGSHSEQLYLAGRDLGAEAAATHLKERSIPAAEDLYVLGLRARWSGELKKAEEYLESAAKIGAKDPELFTTLGNARYLLGDSNGAIAAYNQAIEHDKSHAIAYFNLSRVYYSVAEHQKANRAHRLATAIDYEVAERFAQEAKRLGPRYVVEDVVPRRLLRLGLETEPLHGQTVRQIWSWLGGKLARPYFAAAAIAGLVLVIFLGWLGHVLGASASCPRCGRPACSHCNPEMPDRMQCGQCYHAFVATSGVAPQVRIGKEIEVHRYQASSARIRRVFSLVLAGAGQLMRGDSLLGIGVLAAFSTLLIGLAVAADVLPEMLPLGQGVRVLSLSVFVVALVAVYTLALWDEHRGRD